jgi:hypothetical protein
VQCLAQGMLSTAPDNEGVLKPGDVLDWTPVSVGVAGYARLVAAITESTEPEYQVALSFAGEQRAYVREVASELAKHGVKPSSMKRTRSGFGGRTSSRNSSESS